MSELSYITTSLLNQLAEDPGRMVTVLEYACGCTLLIALLSDSLLRRRHLARQKSSVVQRQDSVEEK